MSQRSFRKFWGALSVLLAVVMFASPLRSTSPMAAQAQEAPTSTQTVTPTATPTAEMPVGLPVRTGHFSTSREIEKARRNFGAVPTVTPTTTPTATPKQADSAVTPTPTGLAQAAQATPAPLVERNVRPDEWGGRVPEGGDVVGPFGEEPPVWYQWTTSGYLPHSGSYSFVSSVNFFGDWNMGHPGSMPQSAEWATIYGFIRLTHPVGTANGASHLDARIRSGNDVISIYHVATSLSQMGEWTPFAISLDSVVMDAIRGRGIWLDWIAYGREANAISLFWLDDWGLSWGGPDPTSTPSPTPTATPTSTPTPRPSNNAAQIARRKATEEEYRGALGEGVHGPEATQGVIELTPVELESISPELQAQIKQLASRERQPIPFMGLADPANGWYRFAVVPDHSTGDCDNCHIVLGGNSGFYSITPLQPDHAMSVLQWSGARGRDWAPRKIETSLVLYPTVGECTVLTMALTDRAGNILQIGTSGNLCTQFQWQRFRMNLNPVVAGDYGIFIQTSGDVRLDDIEGLYSDSRVGLVSYLPIPGSTGLCANGYTQIRAPGATSGRVMADELFLESDDVVYPGNLSPVLDDVPAPGQWLCRLAEDQITYAVGGMGAYRVDFSTVVAGVGTLAIPRGLITGTTLVAGTAGTTTTGLVPIGTLTGLGGGILFGAGAAAYGFAVWRSYGELASTLAWGQISTAWMDPDNNSGPYVFSFRLQPPVPTVWLIPGTFDTRPAGLIEKYLLGGVDTELWDVLDRSTPGAEGPFSYAQAIKILMQREAQVPPQDTNTPIGGGHVWDHPDGKFATAKRMAGWVITWNQCVSNPATCRCWQRGTDRMIVMIANGARIVFMTGGVLKNIGAVFTQMRDWVPGTNPQSTALSDMRLDGNGKPIDFSAQGPDDVHEIGCPDFPNDDLSWPWDMRGLAP